MTVPAINGQGRSGEGLECLDCDMDDRTTHSWNLEEILCKTQCTVTPQAHRVLVLMMRTITTAFNDKATIVHHQIMLCIPNHVIIRYRVQT